MREVYDLPSLSLSTQFDEPVVSLEVPGELVRGTESGPLCILDGVNRAPHRLARATRPSGLLGLRVPPSREGLRLNLRLFADDLSTRMWHRHREFLEGRRPGPGDAVPDVSAMHRVVAVSVQGRPQGLVTLVSRPSGSARQHVTCHVDADDIDESGLIMIGLETPDVVPAWFSDGLMPDPLVGVCLGRLAVKRPNESREPQLSTGLPGVRTAEVFPRLGSFVVNPTMGDRPVDLRLTPLHDAGERLRGRRQRVRHPVRAARQEVADRQLLRSGDAHVEVVDSEGELVLDRVVARHGASYEVRLPGGVGPVFVRVCLLRGDAVQQRVGWHVEASASG